LCHLAFRQLLGPGSFEREFEGCGSFRGRQHPAGFFRGRECWPRPVDFSEGVCRRLRRRVLNDSLAGLLLGLCDGWRAFRARIHRFACLVHLGGKGGRLYAANLDIPGRDAF
jgi:hypothetical protein